MTDLHLIIKTTATLILKRNSKSTSKFEVQFRMLIGNRRVSDFPDELPISVRNTVKMGAMNIVATHTDTPVDHWVTVIKRGKVVVEKKRQYT